MGLAERLMKYGRPFWAAIGEDNAADVAGAANVAASYLFGPDNVSAEEAFYQGRRDYERDLHDARWESPFAAFGAEALGTAAFAGLGGIGARGAVKAFKMADFVRRLYEPYGGYRHLQQQRKTPEPYRTRKQWRADLEYGKEQFNRLRARGPLKREGHPDAIVNRNTSWPKIRQGNHRKNYDMLEDVPDIYATGEYHMQPRLKERNDNFEKFHWFQKGNRGIQVAENKDGRVLYNINPDVRQFLLEHPGVAEKLGIDLTKL